ncbi:hypothetical protein UFOVP480_15 [uncultured Caudovirales phage]|uniref:Uncharacterized protein n=1 Tax=uncultured Caudovirales phage TaxID=2100421 RepID=A0A6J5MK70_9CAUD|nr:hypothetical protein UFOVP480_15 [uncultured Caudovirales phage]CAB4189677.1 hypothetical protein UFOVP1206_11 [uncultured Caudovirales phage]
MAVPVVNAFINFSTGPSFAQAMILDQGLLGTNVLADSAAVIVDVSNQIDYITTNRGRQAEADQFQTGTLSLRIVDQNGDFNPQNPGSPYFGLLSPMRKVQITATYGTVTYSIFSGFITSYSTTTPQNALDVVYTTINAVDAFRLAQNAQISTVSGTSAGQLSGARINNLLDAISWPASMRDIDAGLTTMQADPGTARTALAAMQTVETSEYGALYVDASGSFVFQDRALTASSVAGTPTLFNDDGTNISYNNAVWILNDVLVYNQANVTRTGGAVQTATDQPSIDKYFLHSYNQQNLLMQTDAVALDYAQAYVASRAETSVRCDAITLDLYTDNYNTGIIAGLSLDFFDPVTITTNQPGASTLTKTLQIFGVSMSISPNLWKVTFTTLEPIIDGFILDNAIYGLLDTGVLSY